MKIKHLLNLVILQHFWSIRSQHGQKLFEYLLCQRTE